MHVACFRAQVHFAEEGIVIGVCRETLVLLLEHDGIWPFLRVAVRVIVAVLFYRIDKEQAQHLNILWTQAQLFVEMLLDSAPYHLALHRVAVHVTDRLPGSSLRAVHSLCRSGFRRSHGSHRWLAPSSAPDRHRR